jgi:hypothetical protein
MENTIRVYDNEGYQALQAMVILGFESGETLLLASRGVAPINDNIAAPVD